MQNLREGIQKSEKNSRGEVGGLDRIKRGWPELFRFVEELRRHGVNGRMKVIKYPDGN